MVRTSGKHRQTAILGILRQRDRPMTAYEILGELKDDEAKLAPPTVYRALAALTSDGRAHRLESLNAFVRCQCEHEDGPPILTVCDTCGDVDELVDPGLIGRLDTVAENRGFRSSHHVVEVHGTCASCV